MPKRAISYQKHLRELLKNPEAAAEYMEAILEEKDPEPELLHLALRDIVEALGGPKMSSEEATQHRQQIDELLSRQGSEAIYHLAQLLKALGLKLSVTVSDETAAEETEEMQIIATRPKEVTISRGLASTGDKN